ncbi:MAG: VOC family protein [Bacteroidetes bacterium]|nr:VOC family protein [Bacteroidota bacterium]
MNEQITPCLWFDGKAKEAAAFYCAHLSNAKISAQSPIVSEIEISGYKLICLDGGPNYQPNASISFFYTCETATELDQIWAAFEKGGHVLMPLDKYPWSEKYGWVNDQYGISWQFSLGKAGETGPKIVPCMLFTGSQYGRADEAIAHYTSIFKNAGVNGILRYKSNELPDQEGKIKQALISLDGQQIMLMESALPHNFTFSEGVSLTVYCHTQDEVDYYWEKLTENGAESRCGWLKDKFGVSWQIIPKMLGKLMSDPAKAGKAAQAFMEMRKLDIEKIIQATIA